MTVLEAYQHSVQTLRQSSANMSREEAGTQARLLIDHLTGARYAHLLQPDATLQGEASLQQMLDELNQGRPLPYVLGRREFYGLTFRCDERALIPRPETELLVETAITRLKDRGLVTIADLGTGTGCIAISLAHSLPQATLYATDASDGALTLAQENAKEHGVAERVHFLRGEIGDWSGPLSRMGCAGQLDAILSNPPYIAAAEIETLQTGIRDWEPRSALDGGADGLDDYRLIATQCGAALKRDGFLAVELGAGQFDAVREFLTAAGWVVEAPLFDFAGIARVLVARKEDPSPV